jgi:putative membrane protein
MSKSNSSDDQPDERATQPQLAADVQTRFAWLRTRMALQTTLAAWVRTATSLIGFGFAIVQFLEHFGRLESGGDAKSVPLARVIGLVLISAGSLTTAIAMWEYRIAVKYLESDGFRGVAGIPTVRKEPPDVAVWMAVLVCLIGVLAFALILTTTKLR